MRGEVGKETPKKEMDFYDVTYDTSGFLTNGWKITEHTIIISKLCNYLSYNKK